MSNEERNKLSDYVIWNDESLEALYENIDKLN